MSPEGGEMENMNQRLHRLVVGGVLVCLCAWPVHAKRLALVIGNDNYQLVPKLEKAGNDADAVARELEAAGFAVAKFRDLDYRGTVKAFEAFYDRITGGDDVVVFYAGHGVQTRTGNYLLPTDIDGETESQIEKTSYPVNSVLEELDKAKPQFSLIVVDACRDNPLRSRGRTIGAARGLTPPDIAKGQVVIFSASRGQQALDSLSERDANPNGVFTRELVARMRRPGLGIDALALEVRTAVEQLAASVGHAQRPYVSNDAIGNFYFYAAPAGAAAAAAASPGASAGDDAQREDEFWKDTKGAGNREGFEAYLDLYPKGRYANLARANIMRLTGAVAATSPPAAIAAPPQAHAIVQAAPPAVTSTAMPSDAAPPRPVAPAAAAPQVSAPPAPAPQVATPAAAAPQPTARAAPAPQVATPAAAVPQPTARAAPAPQVTAPAAPAPQVVALAAPAGPATAPAPSLPPTSASTAAAPKRIRVALANGDSYDGEVQGDVRVGQGIYVFANGDRYEGGFADDRFGGKGIQTAKSGDRYEGDFLRGLKHGRGVYRFANGDSYDGEFVDNLFSGKGKLVLAGGDRYEGEFRNNVKQGRGIHYFANGERYEGEFAGGLQAGAGTHFYSNGDRYAGQFANGVRNGKGVYRFANGDTRELQFDQGVEKPN